MTSKDSLVRDAVELRLVFALLLLMAVLISSRDAPRSIRRERRSSRRRITTMANRTRSSRPSKKCSLKITWPTRATRHGVPARTSRRAPGNFSRERDFYSGESTQSRNDAGGEQLCDQQWRIRGVLSITAGRVDRAVHCALDLPRRYLRGNVTSL